MLADILADVDFAVRKGDLVDDKAEFSGGGRHASALGASRVMVIVCIIRSVSDKIFRMRW